MTVFERKKWTAMQVFCEYLWVMIFIFVKSSIIKCNTLDKESLLQICWVFLKNLCRILTNNVKKKNQLKLKWRLFAENVCKFCELFKKTCNFIDTLHNDLILVFAFVFRNYINDFCHLWSKNCRCLKPVFHVYWPKNSLKKQK